MKESVDAILSGVWNELFGGVEESAPEQMWAACRVLSEAGFLKGNRESLAVAEIGPFRIATALEGEAFVEGLIRDVVPFIFKVFCSGLSLREVAGGVLVGLFSMVRTVASCSTRISDPVDWVVLLYVKRENEKGLLPTQEDVLAGLAGNDSIDPAAVMEAIERLSATKSITGGRDVYLIVPHVNGRLECRA